MEDIDVNIFLEYYVFVHNVMSMSQKTVTQSITQTSGKMNSLKPTSFT